MESALGTRAPFGYDTMPSVGVVSHSLTEICNTADVESVDGLANHGYTTSDDVNDIISRESALDTARQYGVGDMPSFGCVSPPFSGSCIIATVGRAGRNPAPEAYDAGDYSIIVDDGGRNAAEIAQKECVISFATPLRV